MIKLKEHETVLAAWGHRKCRPAYKFDDEIIVLIYNRMQETTRKVVVYRTDWSKGMAQLFNVSYAATKAMVEAVEEDIIV